MEPRFWPCLTAIKAGDVAEFTRLLESDPELAKARSSIGHPMLMQALVLDGVALDSDTQIKMGRLLAERGSALDEPLISAGSLDNAIMAKFIVDQGGAVDGREDVMQGWTAMEEALYWQNTRTVQQLVSIGASLHNLRIAAGVGDLAETRSFFNTNGSLNSAIAGSTNFPFCEKEPAQVSSEPQAVINNALTYAASAGHLDVADFLLGHGAEINCIPLGFHFRGSALHNAAMHGRRAMCDFLLSVGADRSLPDLSVDGHLPAGWARHGKHDELAAYLEP